MLISLSFASTSRAEAFAAAPTGFRQASGATFNSAWVRSASAITSPSPLRILAEHRGDPDIARQRACSIQTGVGQLLRVCPPGRLEALQHLCRRAASKIHHAVNVGGNARQPAVAFN